MKIVLPYWTKNFHINDLPKKLTTVILVSFQFSEYNGLRLSSDNTRTLSLVTTNGSEEQERYYSQPTKLRYKTLPIVC